MWQDYSIRDFYGEAHFCAQKYLKKHPDAERQAVYFAAQEAAELYERKKLYKIKFRLFVHWKITNDLYKRRRIKGKTMTAELKAAIIAEYNKGKTHREIAEKFSLNQNTLSNNLANWADSGLIARRQESRKKRKKPETATTETGLEKINENVNNEIITEFAEKVKSVNFMKAASVLEVFLKNWLGDIEVVECRASNRDNSVQLTFEDEQGNSYAVGVKRLED